MSDTTMPGNGPALPVDRRNGPDGATTPQERENATQGLMAYIRSRMIELAWDQVIYGDNTGVPTGIMSPSPSPQADIDK